MALGSRRRIALATILSLCMALGLLGPVESADLTEVALVAGPQAVEIAGTGTAQFEASGAGRFKGDSGHFRGQASLTTAAPRYTFRFREAAIIEDASGSPIGLTLSGRGRVERDGRQQRQEWFDFTATVQ